MQAELENGYTRVANDTLDALSASDLSGREFRVLYVVIRRTYGFQKRIDWIALSQIVDATGIAKENVSRIISGLCEKQVIVREGDGYTKKIGINPQLTEWQVQKKVVKSDNGDVSKRQNVESDKLSKMTTGVVESDRGVVENDNGRLLNPTTTKERKETTTKESITKERHLENFNELWKSFDNNFGSKGAKKNAEAEYLKLKPDDEMLQTMITAVINQIREKQSKRDTGQFSPDFQAVERWIKNRRWEDEINYTINRIAPTRQSKSDQNDEAVRRFLEAADTDGRDVDGAFEYEACQLIGGQH